ncbi:rCG63443 [Rattus norvegicus]|uniref:RCG63443 n=1 Tax=Rattus norvegicus TaxID=10116 RepID=A6HC21_RAT|nr:rCG63443 [Rattus norvegicus]
MERPEVPGPPNLPNDSKDAIFLQPQTRSGFFLNVCNIFGKKRKKLEGRMKTSEAETGQGKASSPTLTTKLKSQGGSKCRDSLGIDHGASPHAPVVFPPPPLKVITKKALL